MTLSVLERIVDWFRWRKAIRLVKMGHPWFLAMRKAGLMKSRAGFVPWWEQATTEKHGDWVRIGGSDYWGNMRTGERMRHVKE